jgi:hypothetical protein
VHLQNHRITLHHHTATLDGFNEVFRTLGHETEPGLVGVEFQDAAERLLGYHGEIVGIV